MSGGLAIVSEALLRLEHKLDVLISALGLAAGTHAQMHFTGQTCPVCKKTVDYQVDIVNQVVKRNCGCSSGKQPPLIPLIPVPTTGAPNGPAAEPAAADGGDGAQDGHRRQGR